MKGLKCYKCGSDNLKVNKDCPMLQCRACKARQLWNKDKAVWGVFKLTKKQWVAEKAAEICSIVRRPFYSEEPLVKHPKKEKGLALPYITRPLKIKLLTIKELAQDHERTYQDHLRQKWKQEMIWLLNYGTVQFGKHEHKGRLRGKNIAKAFHTDLTRIGYKTRLSFKGMTGIVRRL